MRHSTILHPLAVSLSQADWNEDAIRHCLAERLPRPLSRLAAPLAQRLKRQFPLGSAPDPALITRHLAEQPETQRVLAFARRHDLRPAPVLSKPEFRPDPALAGLDLPRLATPVELAEWLAITPETLVRFADLRGLSARSSDPFGPHYRPHLHKKSDGQLRLIEEPRPFLKRLQRRILHGLLDYIPVHPAAVGFCAGRNCMMGAQRHAGEALVVSFDLADFFPGIDMPRLYRMFRAFGYPRAVARDLAGLTSAITPAALLKTDNLAARMALGKRHLPQGAPTSPALSNAAAFRLDCRLAGLARRLGATYTRYADDLSFSGDSNIRAILLNAVPDIVADEGFALNKAKTRVMPRHTRQEVTGIVVNERANIKRADFDHLKATLHHLRRPDDPRRQDIAFLSRLSGRIAWVEAVHPHRGQKLRDRLNDALSTL